MGENVTIPQKAFADFTDAEKNQHPPTKLVWKHEGSAGPVYVQFAAKEKDFFQQDKPAMRNYANGMESFDKRYFAKWYTRAQAIKLAKQLKVSFEEV